MSDVYSIRRAQATLAEAAGLLVVEQGSLGDSAYTPSQILKVMRRPEHRAYVATLGETIVGFCSCFESCTPQGKCLEIDMLGVAEAQRGRGLATGLIEAALRKAAPHGVGRSRAVVAVENTASQRAFARAGLVSAPHSYAMMVYPIRGYSPLAYLPPGWRCTSYIGGEGAPDGPFEGGYELHRIEDRCGEVVAEAECLRVQTMAYRGVWLERAWGISQRAYGLMARAIVERAKVLRVDEVGYLVPEEPCDAGRGDDPIAGLGVQTGGSILSLVREGYEQVGRYLVFTGLNASSAER